MARGSSMAVRDRHDMKRPVYPPRVKDLLRRGHVTPEEVEEIITILGLRLSDVIVYEPLTEDVADHYCPLTRSICSRAGMSCGLPACGEAEHPNDFSSLSMCPRDKGMVSQ